MLWKVRVKLDLVDHGFHTPRLLENFEVRNGPVANSNGSHLAGSKDILHLRPCRAEIPVAVDCSTSIGTDREQFIAFILPKISNQDGSTL